MHADVCELNFADNMFHIIVSGDVLEHVPDIDAALRESARVLRPGGRFIGTFPFVTHSERSFRLACLRDGGVVHFVDEPIYHGNPVNAGEKMHRPAGVKMHHGGCRASPCQTGFPV